MNSFPLISKSNRLTCGPTALLQICLNNNIDMCATEILKQLQISEQEDINIVAMTQFLLKNNIKSQIIVKKNSFGEKEISENIKQLLTKDISSRKKTYLHNLAQIINLNSLQEVEHISKELIDKKIDEGNIIVAILHAPTFSNGEFKGQHIAIILDKDESNYIFPGKKLFKKSKDLVFEAISKTKIQSIISVKKNVS